jgi:universal stress protein A
VAIDVILVPTDFSRNAQVAFEHGYEIARQLNARLHLLYVRDESTLRTAVKEGLLSEDSTDEDLEVRVNELIEQRFSEMLAGIDPDSLQIERSSLRGDPKAVVVEFAREIGADLVAIGMSGTGAMEMVRSVVLGSVAESVIRKAHCPALVVRTDHARRETN